VKRTTSRNRERGDEVALSESRAPFTSPKVRCGCPFDVDDLDHPDNVVPHPNIVCARTQVNHFCTSSGVFGLAC